MGSQQPIAARVAGFVAHLRHNDFVLGPAETAAALSAMSGAIASPGDVRRRLKVVLSSRPAEWRRFDALFDGYWLAREAEPSAVGEAAGANLFAGEGDRAWETRLDGVGGQGALAAPPVDIRGIAEEGSPGASSAAVLDASSTVDFAGLADEDEIAEAERVARELAQAIGRRLSRRTRLGRHGSRVDLRRTIRASLARGGEPLDLIHRQRPERPLKLVAFVDISGSMKPHARFLLQFVKGLFAQGLEVEAFLLHTRMIRATEALAEPDPAVAMARLSGIAQGFGGGTRIGLCLRRFNDRHARRMLNADTVVMVMSDGYDTGASATLANALARIRNRARAVVWLNPLAGKPGFRPVALAMLAALPHVDHLAPANSLAALAAIEPELRRL